MKLEEQGKSMRNRKGFTPRPFDVLRVALRGSNGRQVQGQRGFTLIEMLVVIAIIGILSAAVLVSLGPARNKAKDARIISALKQAVVLLEGDYNASTGSYPTLPVVTNTPYETLDTDIKNNGGTGLNYNTEVEVVGGNVVNARISSGLNSNANIFCVDTTGFSGEVQPAMSTAGHCK